MSKLTVWHDGGCPLCQQEIALMRRLDRSGRIEFVDATEAGVGRLSDRPGGPAGTLPRA
jgi:predicted DCC family thiol-disulfide oxidoreductase YuxK